MTTTKTVHGWTLFWPGPRMSQYVDGSRVAGDLVVIGETVSLKGGRITPCEWGLHGSERLLDALGFSPCERPVIGHCQFTGSIKRESDKLAARSRTALWVLDEAQSKAVLRTHARWSALTVLHLWEAPDMVVRHLVTGDESLRDAAWDAARAAARDAAWDAARAAAWAAARAAARAADRAAARDAAWDAAWAAARDAAWAAAWAAAAWDAAWDAAWAAARAAAWAAARDAAWAASNSELERLAWAAHAGEPVTLAIPDSARDIVARVMGEGA